MRKMSGDRRERGGGGSRGGGTNSPLEYETSMSSQVETNSWQQHCRGLGQQSMNEGAGKPYSPTKTEMEEELEELRHQSSSESLWCCDNGLTVQDLEV